MQDWLSFFSCFFWFFIFIFYLQPFNFIKMLIASELCWVIIYVVFLCYSVLNNNLFLINSLFYLFGFAAIEFSLGLLLMLIFNHLNNSLFFDKVTNFAETKNIFKNFFKKK